MGVSQSMTLGVFFALVVGVFATGGRAQDARSGSPAFEAVSVRQSGSSRVVWTGPSPMMSLTTPFRYSGEHLTCDLSLRSILQEAFSPIKDFQLAGPAWIDTAKYRISALMPAGTTKEAARRMLQTMLKDRFGFKFHWERKELSAYGLMKAKRGFKLQPADTGQAKDLTIKTPMGAMKGTSYQGPGQFRAMALSLDGFADWLGRQVDAPVVNLTDIEGAYDIDLSWEYDRETAGPGGVVRRSDSALLKAMESGLGLRLERRKLPVEVLMIDRIEKTPTEN